MLLTQSVRNRAQQYELPSTHTKRMQCFFLLCVLQFCTVHRCSMPLHTLLTDIVETCGGSSVLVHILNRLRAVYPQIHITAMSSRQSPSSSNETKSQTSPPTLYNSKCRQLGLQSATYRRPVSQLAWYDNASRSAKATVTAEPTPHPNFRL